MKYDLQKNLIAPFWQDVIDRLRDNLIERYPGSSLKTYGLIEEPKFTVGDRSYKIELIMPDYYAYMDEGVRGTGKFGKNPTVRMMRRNTGRFSFKDKGKGKGGRGQKGIPPIEGIRNFMRNRGIVGRTVKGKRGTKSSTNQLDSIAYSIAHSIWQTGLQQSDFYSDVVNDQLINNFADQLLEELGQEVIINIKEFGR